MALNTEKFKPIPITKRQLYSKDWGKYQHFSRSTVTNPFTNQPITGQRMIDPRTGVGYIYDEPNEQLIPYAVGSPRLSFTGAGERTTPYVSPYAGQARGEPPLTEEQKQEVRVEHLAEAKKASEESGKSIKYHLRQAELSRAMVKAGGKPISQMTPVELKSYSEKRKLGYTPAEASATVTKLIEVPADIPGKYNPTVKVSVAELENIQKLSGIPLYNKMVSLGMIPVDTKPIGTASGAVAYIPHWNRVMEEAKGFVRTANTRREALAQLEDYRVGSTNDYYVAEAMAGGISRQTLLNAGFKAGKIDSKEMKSRVIYLKASPQEKFKILQAEGAIPSGAKYSGIDNEGNISYTIPEVPTASISNLPNREIKELESDFLKQDDRTKQTIIQLVFKDRFPQVYPGYNLLSAEEQSKIKSRVFGGLNWDNMTRTEQLEVLAYVNGLEPVTIAGKQPFSKWQTPELRVANDAAKWVSNFVPVLGTVVNWSEMKDWERGLSIAGDALFIGLMTKPLVSSGAIARAFTLGKSGNEVSAIKSLLKTEVNTSKKALNAIDSRLSKSFSAMADARSEYVENIAQIKNLENVLSKSSGEVVPEIERHLSILRGKTVPLRSKLQSTASEFVNAQRNAVMTSKASKTVRTKAGGIASRQRVIKIGQPAYDVESLISKGFPKELIRDTDRLVEMQFERIPSIKEINRQIVAINKRMEIVKEPLQKALNELKVIDESGVLKGYEPVLRRAKGLSSELNELAKMKTELLAKRAISSSANVRELALQITKTRMELELAQNKLTKLRVEAKRMPVSERSYSDMIRLQNKIVNDLTKQEANLTSKYISGLKGMDIQWAEPIPKQGGRTIVSPGKFGQKLPRISGGGRIPQTSPVLTPAVMGLKVIASGDDWIEYSYTPKVIEVPGRETMPVEPQPMWEGLVKTEIAEPEAPPTPIREPTPAERPPEYPKTYPYMPMPEPLTLPITPKPHEPAPGRITWTPSVVLTPRLNPQEAVVIQVRPSVSSQSKAEEALGKAISVYKTSVALGESAETATKTVNKAVPEVSTRTASQTGIKIKTSARTRATTKASVQTEVMPSIETRTATVPATRTTTTTTTTTKTPALTPKRYPLILTGKLTDEKEKGKKEKDINPPIAFRQGFIWWVFYPPYKSRKDVKCLRTPPRGATVVKGAGSAYKTIQALGGNADIMFSIDMGIFDVKISKPSKRSGKAGALRYRLDREQKTTSDLSVKGVKVA